MYRDWKVSDHPPKPQVRSWLSEVRGVEYKGSKSWRGSLEPRIDTRMKAGSRTKGK